MTTQRAKKPAVQKHCRECGTAYTTTSARSVFCGVGCRKTHSNRRAMRGAQIYDLFMAVRYERQRATDGKYWGILCRIAERFRREDLAEREGRSSWQDAGEILGNDPSLRAVTIVGPARKKAA